MENKMQIVNISGVQCYEKNGVAYLDLEAVGNWITFLVIIPLLFLI